MVKAPRQLQCAARPQAAVGMPQLPTSQAWLAAPGAAFLAGPGVKKNPPEQDVPRCSPVTSRWKVGPLLMEMVLTDLQSSRMFSTCRQGCGPAAPAASCRDVFPFLIKSSLFGLYRPLPTTHSGPAVEGSGHRPLLSSPSSWNAGFQRKPDASPFLLKPPMGLSALSQKCTVSRRPVGFALQLLPGNCGIEVEY